MTEEERIAANMEGARMTTLMVNLVLEHVGLRVDIVGDTAQLGIIDGKDLDDWRRRQCPRCSVGRQMGRS